MLSPLALRPVNSFYKFALLPMAALALAACSSTKTQDASVHTQGAKITITQVRNATIQINYAGKKLLVDPMLAKKGAYPGFDGTVNSQLRNPLVELPFAVDKILDVDAILVTHLHPDHWDEEAQKVIPKDKLIFAQNKTDAAQLKIQGFRNVTVLTDNTKWGDITLIKTKGQHGTDDTMKSYGKVLGEVSGFVMTHASEKSIYVAGDTIWNTDVDEVLLKFKPGIIILNAGAATITGSPPIIMGKEDVLKASKNAPSSQVIATHMEAVNHATLSRKELRDFLEKNQALANVKIPLDGEILTY